MNTFINFDIEKPIHWKFLVKHILFFVLWTSSILIIVFRIDLSIASILPIDYHWVKNVIPFFMLSVILVIMYYQKWYYNIALILYPLLAVLWFIPKIVLAKGKIYLFLNYMNFIFSRFKRFKSCLGYSSLFVITVLLLALSDSNGIRLFSILVFTFFYIRLAIGYIKSSFKPPQLFGEETEKAIMKYIVSPDATLKLIKNYEEQKSDEKLSDDEKKTKRLHRLIMINYVFEYLGHSLSGFKGKKAFVIAWIYQLIGFFVISLIYLTFINFELYVLNPENFEVQKVPNLFYFFYYTLKTMTFDNIEFIKPASELAMFVEIFSFLVLGVFVLVIVTSVIFSLKMDKMSDNLKKATEICIYQNKVIAEHIQLQYQTDIQTVLNEFSNIKKSLSSLKRIIDKIF